MGMFDNMAKALFKEKEDGTTIYFGNGLLKEGYIVTDPEQKEKLYKFHKNLFKYMVPLGIVYSLLLGLSGAGLVGFVPVLIVSILIYLKQKSLTKGLPKANEKLSATETRETIAKSLPRWFVLLMIINGVLGIMMAIFLYFAASDLKFTMGVFFVMGLMLLVGGIYLNRVRT